MVHLFGNKWIQSEGEHMDGGKPTDNFLRWCAELSNLTDEQWRRAYECVDKRVREAARTGDECWPPSSVAFIEYSRPPRGSEANKYFAKKYAAIEAKALSKEENAKRCAELLKLFN